MFTFDFSRELVIQSKKLLYSQIFRRYCVKYVQGQSPEPRVREYFYYIDHQGMVQFVLLIKFMIVNSIEI